MRLKKLELVNKILNTVLVLISILFVFSAILIILVYMDVFGALPNNKQLSSISNEEASLVFSSDSVIIGKYFAENRTNIKWDQVPIHLKNALIATEDKRFFSHKGFDRWSYFRVLFRSILSGDRRGGGGSTITQQLVKNLYGRGYYGFLSMPVNKIKEVIIASELEEIYTKEELLLLYLNSVPFGEEVYGVESASQRYFGKPAIELKIEESAVLVGILKANTYFNPQLNPENSLSRRNLILKLMNDQKYITARELDSLQKLPLNLKYENLNLTAPAGYFVYQVKKKAAEILEAVKSKTGKTYDLEKDGLKIYTTLDSKLQKMSTEAVKNHLAKMQKLLDKELENKRFKKQWLQKQTKMALALETDSIKRNVELLDWDGFHTQNINKFDSIWHYYKMLNASVLISNPKNGAVLTWIGGNNYRILPFDMVLSHRQIASAFKPVLYATALETGISPCAYLQNEENKYPGYEDWEPQNANLESTPDSTVALWYALTNSMNLPAVDLFFKVGKENLASTCEKLNFPHYNDDAPSIAIGTLDLSLFEIVRAYGTFANKGAMNDLYMITKITDANDSVLYTNKKEEPSEVFTNGTSQLITVILQQVINQGTGVKIRNQFGIKSPIAGKTGTAQNYSDAWFVAYTPDMVIGTWVGAATPDVHFYSGNGAGSSLALPISATIIKGMESDPVLKRFYLTPFDIPEEVYLLIDCEPFRQTGIKGFVNRLFSRRDKNPQDSLNKGKDDDNNSFFKKLFKKDK
jgi:penicillin-binding protein 1A